MSSIPRIVIAAGGTGGHIFPGLALAGAIRRARSDAAVTFVGTPRGLEGELIPKAGYPLRFVDMVPLTGGLAARARFPFALARATLQARRVLRGERASVAVGMGGYASAPLMIAARIARVPSVLHESGAIAGRANALAARLTRNVAVAFSETARHMPGARVVGMPVEREVAEIDRESLRPEARASFDVPAGARVVLVSGGSQGAARLNELACGLAARWRDRDDIVILVKTGRAQLDEVRARLQRDGGARAARAVAFFEQMDLAYAAADVAITRAGAGTVAEIANAGLPAILVPYPHAPFDHQARNAGPLVRAGAALMVRDGDATADSIAPMVEELLADPSRRTAMTGAARDLARPRAADDLALWVLELAGA